MTLFAACEGRSELRSSDAQTVEGVVVVFYSFTPYRPRYGNQTCRTVGEAFGHALMYLEALCISDRGDIEEAQRLIQ